MDRALSSSPAIVDHRPYLESLQTAVAAALDAASHGVVLVLPPRLRDQTNVVAARTISTHVPGGPKLRVVDLHGTELRAEGFDFTVVGVVHASRRIAAAAIELLGAQTERDR